MKMSGMIIGFLFGFLLKRGRFCIAGTIQDVYLEKQWYNLVLIFALISTEAFLYHIMILFNAIPLATFKYFSLSATIIGGIIFGIGSVMSSGCITSTLIKTGDGRLMGILSLITFVLGTAIAKNGILKGISQFLFSKTLVKDELYKLPTYVTLLIFGIILLATYTIMFFHYKKEQNDFKMPQKYKGARHLFCEKIWKREVIVIFSGILMAEAFYFSNLTGRNDGFGITVPLFSLFNFITNAKGSLDWGVMLVLGIILGSIFTTFISGELYIVSSSASSIIKNMLGGLLMGIGASWASGCIISNGLVGTAQLSLRSYLALACIMLGIWASTHIVLIKTLKRK